MPSCVFVATFVLTMVTVYPDHHARGNLPQSREFYTWQDATHALVMAGFTGEPLDLLLNWAFIEPLGPWQKVNFAVFLGIYVLFIFLSLILLLNLLIALLAATFVRTQNEATLQGRIAFARVVLRLERIAEVCGINTNAGEADGDGFVHKFKSVERNREGEVPREYGLLDFFDRVPELAPEEEPDPILTSLKTSKLAESGGATAIFHKDSGVAGNLSAAGPASASVMPTSSEGETPTAAPVERSTHEASPAPASSSFLASSSKPPPSQSIPPTAGRPPSRPNSARAQSGPGSGRTKRQQQTSPFTSSLLKPA